MIFVHCLLLVLHKGAPRLPYWACRCLQCSSAACHHKHWVELALQHPIYGHFLMLMLLWFSLCFFNLHSNANRFLHFSHSNLQTSSWKCLMRVSKLLHIWYTFTSFWVGLNKMEQQISLCRKTFVTNMKLLMIFSIICV